MIRYSSNIFIYTTVAERGERLEGTNGTISMCNIEVRAQGEQRSMVASINIHSGGKCATLAPAFWATASTAPAISTTPNGLLNIILGVGARRGEQDLGS